jgi:hypothetical protein
MPAEASRELDNKPRRTADRRRFWKPRRTARKLFALLERSKAHPREPLAPGQRLLADYVREPDLTMEPRTTVALPLELVFRPIPTLKRNAPLDQDLRRFIRGEGTMPRRRQPRNEFALVAAYFTALECWDLERRKAFETARLLLREATSLERRARKLQLAPGRRAPTLVGHFLVAAEEKRTRARGLTPEPEGRGGGKKLFLDRVVTSLNEAGIKPPEAIAILGMQPGHRNEQWYEEVLKRARKHAT